MTSDEKADYEFPAWSPDGKKIAFDSNVNANFDIYVADVDGTNQTRLTDNSTF